MTATTASPLEPAEFYLWFDGRGEWEFLFNLNQVEAGPGEMSPASVTAFAAPRPQKLAHIDAVIGHSAEGQLTSYDPVVSAEWRAAIEDVEPGVHLFVPHELRFTDAIVSDRFVFRCRTRLNVADLYYHVEEMCDVWGDVVGYRFVVNDALRVPMLDREQVAGRHAVSGPHDYGLFVSRALAERLRPLLPDRTALLPVAVSGEAPFGLPSVPPTPIDDAPPPSRRLDPELAAAIGVFNDPLCDVSDRNRAEALLESRLADASIGGIFDIMAEALTFDVPLVHNFVFGATYCACYERDPSELLAPCRVWAADPSPLRRVAAARMLARPIRSDERPDPEVFAILTGLLDDPDPNVVTETLRILFWLSHPSYNQALRSRRDRFAHHDSEKLREACRTLIDGEPEPGIGSAHPPA